MLLQTAVQVGGGTDIVLVLLTQERVECLFHRGEKKKKVVKWYVATQTVESIPSPGASSSADVLREETSCRDVGIEG